MFLVAGAPVFAQTTAAEIPAAGIAETVAPDASAAAICPSINKTNTDADFDRIRIEEDLRKVREELLLCKAGPVAAPGKKGNSGIPPLYRPSAPKPTMLRINPESIAANGTEVRGPGGRAYFVLPLPKVPAPDSAPPAPIAYVDAPQNAMVGHPFALMVRVAFTAAERVQAERAGFKRLVLDQNVPAFGTARLSAGSTTTALFDAASQDFYVSPGLAAERVWYITPQNAGEVTLKMELSPYLRAPDSASQLSVADLIVQVKPEEINTGGGDQPATPKKSLWETWEIREILWIAVLVLIVGFVTGWLIRGYIALRSSRAYQASGS